MPDTFKSLATSLSSPATGAASISPSNNSDLAQVTRAIYVGGPGRMTAILADGAEITFENMAAGMIYPLRVSRIKSTNTTATGLVALW